MAKPDRLITVMLQKPHTHAGIDLMPGATIDVDAPTAKWLVDMGIGVTTKGAGGAGGE